MLLNWIKWKLKIRWENQINHILFFKNKQVNNKWIWIVIWSFINFFTLLGGSYFLFKSTILNERLIINEQPSSIISTLAMRFLFTLREDYHLLWSILFFIIFIHAIVAGIASSKWQLQSIDRDWLIINLKISAQKSNIYIYLETLIWDSRNFLITYVPIMLSIGHLLSLKPIKIILISLIAFLCFLLLGIMSSIFHNRYINLQKKRVNSLFRIVTSILIRSFLLVTALELSKSLMPWIKDFPLTSNNIEIEEYYEWMQLGITSLGQLFGPLEYVISFHILPNSILANYAIGDLEFHDLLIFCLLILIAGGLSVFLAFDNSKPSNKNYSLSFYEKWIISLSGMIKTKPYITFLIKSDLRTDYFFNRFPIIFGPFSFWIQVGIYTSFIQIFEPADKMYHLILSFYFYFFVYFYVSTMFSNLNGMYSLDSIGNRIILHLISKNNVWSIFLYKIRLFLITTLPLFIVCDIVFIIINRIPSKIAIIIVINHMLFYLLLSTVLFLPSVICPHYNFLNLEQLEDYPDQKTIRNSIKYLTVGVFIPCLMLPAALLMSDYISISQYLIVNVFGTIALFFILLGSIIALIKSKLINYKSLDDFSL
ncbi:hypothetical protein [Niallia sp. FSL M8-0099]|uniref:hypothetical protein n=1 Tax=Niallia sp. FSL M8-0099 TaxID=2954519 RepID=UPI0030FADB54